MPLSSFARLLVASLLLAHLAGCVSTPPASSPAVAGERIPAEEIRADFAQLYETLQRTHYNLYAHFPKTEYDRYYEAYRALFNRPLSRLEAAKLFQQFVALGRVAHANIGFPVEPFNTYLAEGGKVLSLQPVIENGRMWVGEGHGPDGPLPADAEVVAVDGEPTAQWLRRMTQHVSADTPRLAQTLLEDRFAAVLWLEDGPRESYELTLRDAAGAERTVTVPTRNPSDTPEAAPEVAEAFDWNEREGRMLDDEIAYLRPGPFYNHQEGGRNLWDTSRFERFVDNAFVRFRNAKARALIVDLRHNPGGDNSFSDYLLAYFALEPFRFASDFRVRVSPEAVAANEARRAESSDDTAISHRLAAFYAEHEPGDVAAFEIPLTEPRENKRFDGLVYVLVDRRSFSNAVSVAAIVQDLAFGRVLGEVTADLATTYGAMEHFTLDHTGLVVGFPKALIVRPNGDVNPGGVVPDVVLETPPGPEGPKAALDAVVDIVRRDLSEEVS